MLSVGLALTLWQVSWDFAVGHLRMLAQEDIVSFVCFCLASIALLLLTYLVFRRSPGQQRRRRTGVASETFEELGEALRCYNQQTDAVSVRRRSF